MIKKDHFRIVTKPVKKVDAAQLVTGKPVYTEDIAPKDCLVVKLLRSTIPAGIIDHIDTGRAMKVPGIVGIYTYEDVPNERYTNAGQTYAEMSPYDRLLLDRYVRFIGDPIAIVAGETANAVDKALKLIKVQYTKTEPVFDIHTAKDNPVLVHPEDNWKSMVPVGADNKRNLVSSGRMGYGDAEKVLSECDIVLEDTFHLKANSQTMMEPFKTYCEIDTYGKLHVVSSTQIIFHVRRIVGAALGIPKSKVRVTKPRIGGGFGAKQTSVTEVYPAFVTWKTKRPSMLILSRVECQIAGSPRHEMELKVRLGAMNDGTIRAIDMYTLSNSGAYGEHGPTTVGLSGMKSMPTYTNNLEAYNFEFDVVYTNVQAAGAFRGYGAPQGIFAVESLVNRLAAKIGMDPVRLREMNMVRQGQVMIPYDMEVANSCALDRCLERTKQMFGWDSKPDCWRVDEHHIRAKGMSLAMQGSCISGLDVGGATLKLTEDGGFALLLGCSDMGTGCDTILTQMVCEMMGCEMSDVEVFSADTEFSPYDSGSYASSTTYITGMAVVKACEELQQRLLEFAGQELEMDPQDLKYTWGAIVAKDGSAGIEFVELATRQMSGRSTALTVTTSHSSPISPPPFMAGMVEIEIDEDTGETKVIDYVAVADPGTVINENLARVQLEGGLVQGIGMALYEDIHYSESGSIFESSFLNYRIPCRTDIGTLRTAFESSYEPTGPFGAKSIGEMVINTPCPAIAHAIFNATGTWLTEVPFTPEKILRAKLAGGRDPV